MRKPLLFAAFLAFELGGAVAAAVYVTGRSEPQPPSATAPWREMAWPFPLDQFGHGRAFRCAEADCGANVTVLIRTKSGFCNCTAGIADDEELDRVSDVELFGPDLPAHATGRVVRLGGLDGRMRVYAGAAREEGILAAALHVNCDAVVVTALAPADQLEQVKPAVLDLLDRTAVLRPRLAAR